MSKTITPTEFAAEIGTDGRTVRKFLRSITPKDEQPGKGSRWALPGTKRDVTSLTKRFNEWSAKQEADRAARDAAKQESEVDENDEVDDSEIELDEE